MAGSNITITTSTPGQITIAASGGSSGWLYGSGLIYNATTSDVVGIGTTTPTEKLTVQGNGYFTGNVGIGIVPTAPLQFKKAASV
jgi:hypothetical protein